MGAQHHRVRHGQLARSGKTYTLSNPGKRGAEARTDLPAPVAMMMGALGIEHFVEFDAVARP
ncbi:hypothetical protein [Pseudonocardia acidicola]|uniref:Uncharacterized protein n=1 Tax=Pseudonocardia acidicola TaxID=2724939 RepID=A0ABX1SHW6_9PSEU|nr:hypothetical protein [Pseudonocardia acidicola]NMI00123.1 hypothetical protein [Pseudonocardia acidicola]